MDMETLRAAAAPPFHYGHGHYHDYAGAGDGMLATVAEERPPPRQRPTKPQEQEQEQEHGEDSDYDPEQGEHLRSPKRQRTGYGCVHCNMTFTEKRALARHKKTDHHRRQLGLPPDRKHACAMCGKHFTRGHDLKRHQNEQHSEQNTATATEMSSGSSEYSNASTYVEDRTSQSSSATGSSTLAAIAEAAPLSSTYPFSDASTYAYGDQDDDLRSHGKSFSMSPDSSSSNGRRNSSQPEIKQEHKQKHDSSSPNTSPMTGTLGEGSPGFKREKFKPKKDDLDELPPFTPEASPLKASALGKRMPIQPRDIDAWQPMICMICGNAFEEEAEDLIKHLRWHLDNFKGKHKCKDCRIDFTHAADLERHLQSAAEGHCGFNFPHECTGHHPPGDRTGTLTDYDRVRLFVHLQNWEQAQLHAYIAEINELTISRRIGNIARDRWSEVIRRSRPNSFCSFAISVNTYATAPCDVTDGKLDLGGLQKRLQSMSLGKPGSRLLRRITPSSDDLRSTKTVDKTLLRAVRHGDLLKAQRQIDLGGDVSIIHEDQGPFTTVALWGHGYISRRMAEHRVDEDIMGSCSVCHMNSQTFSRPYNKVKSLLKHGANSNEPGGLCGYPLHTAAWMGKADIVAILIEHGADMNLDGKYGDTLCSVAAAVGYPGHVEVVQLLIDIGADVRCTGPRGSAIDLAKERRRHWSLRLKESKDDEEGEMMSRISCCDQVICALQGASATADVRNMARKSKASRKSMESYRRANVAQGVYSYG
ncbi:hypothetical protein M409DRAFT_21109 [Zasmidium cellare ATCC 36951]|uniref:C2H2-type domain-containing protein n=1 Tax=Zasmidium cellare ATCC 36951 TaxID=1080233 RepID=A0A6A6CM92_ZASCE|nr:uncharacterized protein M409DRAFT_21109 [Zasmidium cellare ATCC 36951]KAF2168357.1 hypothetical protein M409DRAFT_21109 [Zasmidium cellare ATCC 36951]